MSLPTPYYQDEWATIYHGDCRRMIAEIEADIIVTDPPYGIGGSPRRGGKKAGTLDYESGGVAFSWDVADESWIDSWSGPAAIFCAASRIFIVASSLSATGILIYVKTNPHPNGSSFEPCVTRGFGIGGRHISAYNAENGQVHPTQKPLAVMEFIVHRAPAGTILDPFMGSGTTLRAAKNLSRKSIGIEIEERYCEIAAKRLSQEVMRF